MGSRIREDNGGEGAHEGRPIREMPGEGEESVIGSEIPRLGFAAFGMTMALSNLT